MTTVMKMSERNDCISEMPAALKHDDDGDENERTERLHQRNACCLDGRQLAAFSQVTESDERRKQNGQRQCLRNKHQAHVPEEFCKDFERKTFTDKLVDITPKELHHQHKLADEESTHKQQAELLGYKYVELLY